MKKIILALAVCLAFAVGPVAAQGSPADLPALTSASYAFMNQDDVFVVLFASKTCRPCFLAKKELMPELVALYASNPRVHVYVLDVDQDEPSPEGIYLKDSFGIESVPTIVVFKGAEQKKFVGFSRDEKAALKSAVMKAVNSFK